MGGRGPHLFGSGLLWAWAGPRQPAHQAEVYQVVFLPPGGLSYVLRCPDSAPVGATEVPCWSVASQCPEGPILPRCPFGRPPTPTPGRNAISQQKQSPLVDSGFQTFCVVTSRCHSEEMENCP